MNVLVSVLTSTRNQCALSNNGMRVVLCVLITFLTRFWCLGMFVRGMKYESWHSTECRGFSKKDSLFQAKQLWP